MRDWAYTKQNVQNPERRFRGVCPREESGDQS